MKRIFIVILFMTMQSAFGSETSSLITHSTQIVGIDIPAYEEELKKKPNLSLPIDQEIELLNQLTKSELGRFLLENKGLNGYWTAYLIIHGPKSKDLLPIEKWIIERAPAVKATQERFKIFQDIIQQELRSNTSLASIPSGLMDDLLSLDYSQVENVKLVGIDLDKASLEYAKTNAAKYPNANVEFFQKNAWELDKSEEFDLITSNGLNIYEPDNAKVIALYKQFYQALKPEGILVTSFLTPPPALSTESTWKNYNIEDAKKQKAIFSDIIGVSWQAFRTEEQTIDQLQKAGFKEVRIVYDSQGMFPTVIARK